MEETPASTTITTLVSTTLEDDEKIHFTQAATIFAAVCASIFTVIGIGGNLLTVVALLKCPKLRSHATTMFVISLALSDLLFSAVNLPVTATRYIHQEWRLGDIMCRLFPFFFYGNVAASLMSMVAITINRYVLIGYHASYLRIYTKTNIFLMILGVWVFSFGMMVPPLAEIWGYLGYKEDTFSCTILPKDGHSPKKFLMLFGFLMPCLVIVGCYSAIFIKVRQSRRNVQSHQKASGKPGETAKITPTQTPQQKREDMRLTRMMLTIFLCFLVCFLPLMLVNVADDDVHFPLLHIIASVLAWASAIINPFIYAFKNRQYQQAFAKILCIRAVSARSGALPGSGNQRKRGSGAKAGKTGHGAESGIHDKDSKNSTTLADKNGSSKTFLTDIRVCNGDSDAKPAAEESQATPQAMEMAPTQRVPEDKVWCHFPGKK